MTKKNNNTIDFLKCYAALIVFVCHAYIICKDVFGYEFSSGWQFIFKTPAWAGVWIFMIVSGFLAGNGFWSGKYQLTRKSVLSYYKDRFLKVVQPAWVMISIVYIIADPQVPSLSTIVRFLTCTFRGGSSAATGVGATWYVFSIAWLYLLTPIVIMLLQRIEKRRTGKESKTYTILIYLLAGIGLAYRIIGRKAGLEWYRWIYASPIGNLDIFFGGIILNRLRFYRKQDLNAEENTKSGAIKRKMFIGGLLLITLFCAFCYFYGESTKPALLSIYRYIMPTAFLCAVGGVLFNSKENSKSALDSVLATGAGYSFQFYLWHSLVMTNIAHAMNLTGWTGYVVCLLLGALLTGYISFLMTKMQSSILKR